jgi:GNAT superfamily N-acetyltransferase
VSGQPSDLRVRKLRPDDAASVVRLLHQLGYATDEVEVRHRIKSWARDERATALGASVDGRVVACAAVYVVPFFERPGSRARLVALVVDAGYRQRGIGRMLVDRAREFASRRGAVEIEVTSRRTRADAHRFYTDLGFADVSGRSRRYIAEL